MSAIGPKQISLVASHMFGGKADMAFRGANVCFLPKADIGLCTAN